MLIDKKCLLFSLFQLLNVREQEENNPPATNKGWEWDIDFLHAEVGPGLSKNVTKPTMQ